MLEQLSTATIHFDVVAWYLAAAFLLGAGMTIAGLIGFGARCVRHPDNDR